MKKIILIACLLLVGCQSNTADINNMEVTLPDENTVQVELNDSSQNEPDTTENDTERIEETTENTQEQTEDTTQEQTEDDTEDEGGIELTKDNVLWLQESLKIAGFYTARDGGFGPNTEKALKSYQESVGITSGIYDQETHDFLKKVRDEKLAPGYKTDMVLLNKSYYLPASYVPENLREVNVDKNKYMELPDYVADIVEEMFADAKKDGIHIVLASAYRSYDYQEGIFSRRVANNGFAEAETVVAIPGESEHQTGLAIDITTAGMSFGLSQTFENDPAFDWMMANGHKYGFILRYLKGREEDTGYVYEPWHYRYIGDIEAATYIMENDLILEEYFNE